MDIAGSVARVLRGLALSNNPSKTGSTTHGASAGKSPPPVLGETSGRPAPPSRGENATGEGAPA
eukprot:783978-Prorocentrum_lima.AAC.1